MKKLFFSITVLFFGLSLKAQDVLAIGGNFQLHEGASMGIHGDLTNNGTLVANTNTLVGFYGAFSNIVDGDRPIDLFDVEFANQVTTFLQTEVNVQNNANFISGNVLTPLNFEDAFLNFETQGFYTGVNDNSKITGYASVSGQQDFDFPVGSQNQLRPLIMQSEAINPFAKCAYLREDPSNPSSLLNQTFNTERTPNSVGFVTNEEFWILQSDVPSVVTLTWSVESNLGVIAQDIEEIILVGFRKEDNQWVSLSGNTGNGDLNEGIITSDTFTPNDYGAITFGTLPLPTDTFAVNNPTLGNYFVTPNGDGTNDVLVFDNLDELGENFVVIYNKFGQKVFEQANYTNQFNGVSNIDNLVVKRDIGLPEGIYYYIVDALEDELQYQGFFFLDR